MECQECHVVFSTPSNMKRHVKNIHGRTDPVEQIDCPHCYAVFSTRENRNRHVKNIHGRTESDQMAEPDQMAESAIYEPIDCPHCYAIVPNAGWLERHVETYHPVVIKMVACIQNACK